MDEILTIFFSLGITLGAISKLFAEANKKYRGLVWTWLNKLFLPAPSPGLGVCNNILRGTHR